MTDPAPSAGIPVHDPFARAGYSGHPACRLAVWSGGEASGLTAGEMRRVQRLQSPMRQEHLAGSLVLRRQLIGQMAGCDAGAVRLGALPEGAPDLSSPAGWSLSLSNKDSVTVAAMARAPADIGVDVERVRTINWPAMLSMLLPDNETDSMKQALDAAPDGLRAFFRMWTLKEAVLKSTQKGFRAGPKHVETPFAIIAAPGAGQLAAFGDHYDFWTVDEGDLVISLVRRRA